MIARILRVDHAGEFGAIRIYQAQRAVAERTAPDLAPFLTETLEHERRHEARLRELMVKRGVRPCGSLWFWAQGGAVLGAVTALLGREAILACTAAVEQTVHRHLKDQIVAAETLDEELCRLLREIEAEELSHLGFAQDHLPPTRWRRLQLLVGWATEALIWLSTQGASAGLGGVLRRHRKRAEP